MTNPGDVTSSVEAYLDGYATSDAALTVALAARRGDPVAAALIRAVVEYGQQIAQRQSKEDQ